MVHPLLLLLLLLLSPLTLSLTRLYIVCVCDTVCSPHRSRSSILTASRSTQPLAQPLLFLSARRCSSSSLLMAPRSSVVHALLFGVLGAVALSFTWSMVLQWVVKVRLDCASTAAVAGGRRAARHRMSSLFHSLVCVVVVAL